MIKVGIYIYDLNRVFQGGYVNGGGAVVDIGIINSLSKNKNIKFIIFTTLIFNKKINDTEIIYVKKDKKEITQKVKEKNCNLFLEYNVAGTNKIINIHEHSPLFKIKRTFILFRFIKYLLKIKEIIKMKNEFKRNGEQTKYCVVSKKMKNDYMKNFKINENNIFVNYPGCNQPIKILRRNKTEAITFGIIVNNSVNKGGYFSLPVFALLKIFKYKFNVKLVVKNTEKSKFLKILIRTLNLSENVCLLNRFEEMNEFYNQIDCLILPSSNEAFGLVVLEAMSYAKPCLVSATTGAAEIIVENQNGYVFNRNYFDYLKKLRKIINNYNHIEEFNILSRNAIQTSKNFTWEQFTEKLLSQF